MKIQKGEEQQELQQYELIQELVSEAFPNCFGMYWKIYAFRCLRPCIWQTHVSRYAYGNASS